MITIFSIHADWKGEGGGETNLEVGFHPSYSFLGALSIIVSHFQGKAARVKGSRFVYALSSGISTARICWRRVGMGGEGLDGSVDSGARNH